MENFLNFLSNNYIYFLIAAGVLFFALVGLLVDMKKKNVKESEPSEVIPEVKEEVNIPEPTVEEVPAVTEEVVDDYNPAPPMPVEEITETVNNEANNLFVDNNIGTNINTEEEVNTQVVDNTPVMSFDTPTEVPTETSQISDTPEELR